MRGTKFGPGGDGVNQLTYDLAAAQSQAQTLGLTNQTIYGVSVVQSQATIMWSNARGIGL